MKLYTIPGVGQVPAGTAFTLPVVIPQQIVPDPDSPTGRKTIKSYIDIVQYPPTWLQNATDDDLAARGILVEDVIEPPAAPPTAEQLKDSAANLRRDLANGSTSILVSVDRTVPTWTNAESRGSILGLLVASQMNPSLTTNWKGSDGEFHSLDASEIAALAVGIMGYVQACFDLEAAACLAIDAGTLTTHADVAAAMTF